MNNAFPVTYRKKMHIALKHSSLNAFVNIISGLPRVVLLFLVSVRTEGGREERETKIKKK